MLVDVIEKQAVSKRMRSIAAMVAALALMLNLNSTALAQTADAATEATIDRTLAEIRQDCASFESGELSGEAEAVTRLDLTGDAIPEAVIDTSRLRCSSAASLYCGTGGCSIFVIVGDSVTNLLVKGWKTVDWVFEGGGDRILLTQIHGANCGGTNLRRCYKAQIWNEGEWQGVGD